MNEYVPIIIQARCSSSRMPGKVMSDFAANMKMIQFQYRRLKLRFKTVIIATSSETSDDRFSEFMNNNKMVHYRGPLKNVMRRISECMKYFECTRNQKYFVRVGGDDPLISPDGIDLAISDHIKNTKKDPKTAMTYTSYDGGMPYGCASEVFTVKLFNKCLEVTENQCSEEMKAEYLEHTKPAFMDKLLSSSNSLITSRARVPMNWQSEMYLSVDYPEDFLVTAHIASNMLNRYGMIYKHEDLIKFLSEYNQRLIINRNLHSGFGE